MRSDIKEIEDILQHGNEILENRPELYDMSLDELIDELDDGTNEMLSYRWGVAARIVVNSIDNWEIRALVKYLSKINSGILTYEYAGYILLKEYHVDLEDLLIEAQAHDLFDKIVKYVCVNMRFVPKPQRFIDVARVLETHDKHSDYDSLIRNYALAIAESDAFLEVGDALAEVENITQYRIMINLSRNWFLKDITTAKLYIERLLESDGEWSKKTAIYYWSEGTYSDLSIFSQYFSCFECLLPDNEYWILIIPVFINYLSLINDEDKNSDIYLKVIDLLNRIPEGSIEVKRAFLSTVRFQKNLMEDIREILDNILALPFGKDSQTLDLIDSIISKQITSGQISVAIQQLLCVFRVNKYRLDYYNFFNNINSSIFRLSKCSVESTEIALSYLLSNDVNKILFGLGLLLKVGNIDKFKESKRELSGVCKKYSEKEIICIMKTISILSFDSNEICKFAFQFLELLADDYNNYIEFCINQIYYNFPFTMRRLSDKYKDSNNEFQTLLSQKVIELHKVYLDEQNAVKEIKDLYPCFEHIVIINKAGNKQNDQINKKAMSQSFFADLFPMQRLKYGTNVVHVSRTQKKDRTYSSSPLQHMKHECEIPVSYLIDPVEYELNRQAYLEEMGYHETNY